MKNIFRLLFTMLAVLFFSCASNAQEKNTQLATTITDSLKVQLSLDANQYKKAYDANLIFINNAKEVKDSDAGRMDKAKKLKEIDATRDASMKVFLTDKQYALFLEYKKENRKKLKEAIKKRRG